MKVRSFDHVHVYAADLERTLAFWKRHFGAEAVGRLANTTGGTNHLLLLGGQVLVLSTFPAGMSGQAPAAAGDGALTHGFGVAHVGINVDDVEAAIAGFDAAGVPVLTRPQREGLVEYAYVQAPDGIVIELTAYHVEGALRLALPFLGAYNRFVHGMRRLLVRAAAGRD